MRSLYHDKSKEQNSVISVKKKNSDCAIFLSPADQNRESCNLGNVCWSTRGLMVLTWLWGAARGGEVSGGNTSASTPAAAEAPVRAEREICEEPPDQSSSIN